MERPILVISMGLALAALGCGGPSRANVSQGPMPEGGSFSGVWHSPQYGEMQMSTTGNQIVGCYVQNERAGRIQGTVQGNLMRFEWSERREMVVGRPTLTRGRGYFLYSVGGDGDHYIQGEWGADDHETGGGPWNAVRDRRRTRQPDTTCGQGGSGGSSPTGDRPVESFDEGGSSGSSGSGSGTSGSGSDDGLGEL
jgi:hypothetical protein